MSCSCGCGGDRARHFSKLSGRDLACTIARRLIPTVDNARDIRVRLGFRPYQVSIVRTRWDGGRRGVGVEIVFHQLSILPVPKLQDMTTLLEIMTPVGHDETGQLLLSQISGAYSEDVLMGRDGDGRDVDPDQQVYYEVEFTSTSGKPSERRRFYPRGAPWYEPENFQWSIKLERSRESRARNGDPR